ncbi:MAG TPA: ATP-binding protein [Polyangia bacterium]|jgi:hypothetical protein
MRELSLHLLDLLENAVRAGAGAVVVTVAEAPERDRLVLRVEDDGPGLPVAPEEALDPFFTTKATGRVGLGLSLLRAAAEQAGGRLRLGRAPAGGLLVEATLGLRHLDRLPLGDLAATMSVIACTHPELDLACRLQRSGRDREVSLTALRAALPPAARTGLTLGVRMAEQVRAGLAELGVEA